jgi:hypothetical protein
MTTIYGLREVGSDEIRYVGFTNYPLELRLERHRYNARVGWPFGPTEWMRGCGEVEIVALADCCQADARQCERSHVERLHYEGHRLTNRHLLPRQTGAAA